MNRRPYGLIVAAVGLLVATVAFCQQVKKTRTAEIRADLLEFDWSTNVFEFGGNCKLTIGAGYNATMTAPSMTAEIVPKPATVKSLVAKGPVNFAIVTAPDSQGRKRKIVASAKEQATYAEETQIVKLVGDAEADMTPVDSPDDVEAVHFTGQSITANLKTSRLTVDNANLTVRTQLEQ
jgi:lipopolysaccharide export system protein LptA